MASGDNANRPERFGLPVRHVEVPVRGFEVPGWGFEVPGWGFDVAGWGFEVPVRGFEVPGWGFEVPVRGFELPGWGFELPGWGFDVPGRGFEDPGWQFDVPVRQFELPVRGNGHRGTANDRRGSAIDYECLLFGLRAEPGNQDRGGRPSLGWSRAEAKAFGDSIKENLRSRGRGDIQRFRACNQGNIAI